ncbi:peroxisomal membrane anchor protein conserved region-domain-containing protein [Sporodiniella umbellata]|nr:peroxisomal membrane anchor protein conserved region-domain-containing protein [Sporodiniella umbellata]
MADSTNSNMNQKSSDAPLALREDLLKSAVSFLSSANVQSADKEKKIAFLQKKGLTSTEIDEAFKRAGNTPVVASDPLPNVSAVAGRPIPIVPSRASVPQIIYQPLPTAPLMPIQKVFALAVILGMGTVGFTSAIVGVLKKFLSPLLNQITEYQQNRYNQHRDLYDKLKNSLSKYHKENDDLDAVIDQGEEDTVMDALAKHQEELNTKLQELTQRTKERLINRKTTLDANTTAFKSMLYSIETGYSASDPPISSFKSDVRTLKAIMLNRRNFPQ